MRWRAKFKGVDHARKIGVDIFLGIARNLKGLVHDFGLMIADRAR